MPEPRTKGARVFCTFENRRSHQVGLKLMILSLEKHCRDFTLYIGTIEKDAAFADWLRRRAPHATLVMMPPFKDDIAVWHVKAALMLKLFEMGLPEVTWLDADLIVLRDLEELLAPLDDQTLLVAREMNYPFAYNHFVMEPYGLQPDHELEGCVNTCVTRMTIHHTPVLKKMIEYMNVPFFLEECAKPPGIRHAKFLHDQSILELLLCTRNKEWVPSSPVAFIPAGKGIIQELGVTTYSLFDRISNGLGWNRPWCVHILGVKPWAMGAEAQSYRATAVYSAFAKEYEDEVEEPMPWLRATGWKNWQAKAFSFGQPHWVGIGHCVAGKIWQLLKALRFKEKSA